MNDRQAAVAAGPVFMRGEDGEVLFKFVIDGGSVIGPRPATAKDQAEHAGAWEAFARAEGLDALDRDAKGGPGGSLPDPKTRRSRRKGVTHEPADDRSGDL